MNVLAKIQLREVTGMGPGTLAKLSKNKRVSVDVLERMCKELDCNFSDILDYKKENKQ